MCIYISYIVEKISWTSIITRDLVVSAHIFTFESLILCEFYVDHIHYNALYFTFDTKSVCDEEVSSAKRWQRTEEFQIPEPTMCGIVYCV